jgi:SSS family transporter
MLNALTVSPLLGVMTSIDYVIVAVYIVGITALGALFMRGQQNTRDYFLAGRSLGWLPVGISVMATNFSASSLIGSPGYVVANDIIMITRSLCFFFAIPLSVWLFLRFYHKLDVTSVYEYIGRRFDARMRFISSGIFLLLRGSWMATAQYATGLALTQVLGLELWVCVLIVGALVTVYSALGGIKAVIWTDVVQATLLIGAMVLTVGVCVARVPEGISGIWNLADAGDKLRVIDFSWSFLQPTTQSMIIGATFSILASYGVDQVIVQRYFTTKDYKTLVRSAYGGMLATLPVIILMFAIGICIYSYYAAFPDRLPGGLIADQWFPTFIVRELPVGITGLIIAGLLAATMSSADSGVNSLTTVFIVDLYRPWRKWRGERALADTPEGERRELRLARWLSFGFGGAATMGAMFVGNIGTVMEITNKLNGVIGGVLLGIFLAAVLSRRANASGVLLGAMFGTGVIVYTSFFSPVYFMWFGVIGCLSTLLATLLASRCFAPPEHHQIAGLTVIGQSQLGDPATGG